MMSENVSTVVKKSIFIKEFINHGNVSKACTKAGIVRRTYQRWKEQVTFKELLQNTIDTLDDEIVDAIRRKALEGNAQLLMFYAKTRLRHRGFIEKVENETTHKGEGIKFIIEHENSKMEAEQEAGHSMGDTE